MRNSQNSRIASVRSEAQAVDVRAALHGGNQIDVALFDTRPVVDAPRDRPFGGFLFAGDAACEHFWRQPLALAQRLAQVFVDAAGVEPLVLLAGLFDGQRHLQARTQNRLGLRACA